MLQVTINGWNSDFVHSKNIKRRVTAEGKVELLKELESKNPVNKNRMGAQIDG